jgi:calcium-dependent protein kinase
MGQCSEKQSGGNMADASAASPVHAHAADQRVSLKTARRHSSNAALTSARYHLESKSWKLERDYEVLGDVLGQGLCGNVLLAKGRVDGRLYALKQIKKQQVSASKLRQLTLEVEIYLGLDHPNVARLHDVYESEASIALLTECCEGGELYGRLQKRGVYTNADAAEAARQMLRAIGYLHAHDIVHRDVKLENFLYETEDESAQLKLIDFGFAKIWNPSTLMMASCGSIAYVSPDVLSGRGYTNKCDIWSLGVIIWMLLSGYPPFHGDENTMIKKIKAGQADWSHKKRWTPVQEDAIDFVKQLLTKEPHLRPDAKDALNHRWLTSTLSSTRGAEPRLSSAVLRSLRRYADSSRVRRAVLQLLAQELTPEETQELRETFLAIDKSSKGTISLADLKSAIRDSAGRTPTKRRRRGAGIPQLELYGNISPGAASPGKLLECQDATPCSAASPSGASPASVATPARTLRRANSGVMEELFNVMGDEQIFYMDFLAATTETRSRFREEAMRAAFQRLDADESGTIGTGDLKACLGDSFEGVTVEELVNEASGDSHREISFDTFVRVVEESVSSHPHLAV